MPLLLILHFVFPKNNDILLYNHKAVIKKFNIEILYSPYSNFSICPNNALDCIFTPQLSEFSSELHVVFSLSCLFSLLYSGTAP